MSRDEPSYERRGTCRLAPPPESTPARLSASACRADSRNRTAPELTEPLISLPCRESEERKERRLGDESPECREPMNRSHERLNDLCMGVESPEVREPTQEGAPSSDKAAAGGRTRGQSGECAARGTRFAKAKGDSVPRRGGAAAAVGRSHAARDRRGGAVHAWPTARRGGGVERLSVLCTGLVPSKGWPQPAATAAPRVDLRLDGLFTAAGVKRRCSQPAAGSISDSMAEMRSPKSGRSSFPAAETWT